MVQIFPAAQKKPSFSQRLSQGVGQGLEMIQPLIEQHQENRAKASNLEKENEYYERLTGKKLDTNNPEIRKMAFQNAFKGLEEQNKLEGNKRMLENIASTRGKEPGSLEAYASNPALGELVTRPEKTVKEPKKTQASQPIDPEQLNIIKNVREKPEFKNASPSKKYQMMTDAGVSKENSKAEADIFAEEQKGTSENTKAKQHEREFFHTESKKFDETLAEQGIAAEKKNRALESQLKIAHKLGKWDRVVSALAGQSKWGDLLKSSTAQEFDSYALPQMEGLRQILGGVLSDSDIRLIMQKVVTSSKTPQANEKIAKYLMSENNYVLDKKHIADELKRNNGGYRPANFESEIDRTFKERYGNQIKNEYEDLLSLPDDPKKLNQVGRRVVPPGTPLGDNSIKMYMELAGNDPMKATQLAEEDGYDVPE